MKISLYIILFSLSFTVLHAQNTIQFEAKTFTSKSGTLPYQILKPANFDSSKKYPVHLFLHGSGEKGIDNELQLKHGSNLFIEMNRSYPAIVIFPQCPIDDSWANYSWYQDENGRNGLKFQDGGEPTKALALVIELMDEMVTKNYIDANRTYVGGLSNGGMGTLEILHYRPNMFAAATPICGGGHPNMVSNWANKVPIWIFHGENDNVVHPKYSRTIIESLIELGAKPKTSFYPNVGHNSWTNTFAEPNLFSWIYSNSK